MYIYLCMQRVTLLLGFLALVIRANLSFSQTSSPSPTPEKAQPLYFVEILNTFRFGKGVMPTDAEISAKLIDEVKTRRIHFILTDSERRQLIGAGATEALVAAIENALTPTEKQKIVAEQKEIAEMNKLYQIISDNFRSNEFQKLSLAIKAGKEFIGRYGSDERAKEIVIWLKANLPKWEQQIMVD